MRIFSAIKTAPFLALMLWGLCQCTLQHPDAPEPKKLGPSEYQNPVMQLIELEEDFHQLDLNLLRCNEKNPENCQYIIREFSDLSQPFGVKHAQLRDHLRKKYPGKVQWDVYFGINESSPEISQMIVKMMLCSLDSGKGKAFYRKYINNVIASESFTLDNLKEIFESDAEIDACLDSPEITQELKDRQDKLNELKVPTLPILYLDNIPIIGPTSDETLLEYKNGNINECFKGGLCHFESKTYLACEYYDRQNPYAPLWHKKWTWARSSKNASLTNEEVPLYGRVLGSTFYIHPSQYKNMEEVRQECFRSIPEDKELIRPVGFNSALSKKTFYIALDKESENEFKSMVIFGDSLSDNGNVVRYIPLLAPHWNGRFTNGPVWNDYIGAMIPPVGIENHAHGGAKSSSGSDVSNWYDRFRVWFRSIFTGSFKDSIDTYVSSLGSKAAAKVNENIYVLWIGGNNYIENVMFNELLIEILKDLSHSSDSKNATIAVREAVTDIVSGLRKLHAIGARKFMVLPIPDLGVTPYCRDNRMTKACSVLTEKHNTFLREAVANIRQEFADEGYPTTIIFPAIDKIVSEAFQNSSEFGIKHTHEACWSSNSFANCNDLTYLFFDTIHPSTLTHCWAAWKVHQELYEHKLTTIEPRSKKNHLKWCMERSRTLYPRTL